MADISLDLSPWQRMVYQDQTRFKVIVAGRRCGKNATIGGDVDYQGDGMSGD